MEIGVMRQNENLLDKLAGYDGIAVICIISADGRCLYFSNHETKGDRTIKYKTVLGRRYLIAEYEDDAGVEQKIFDNNRIQGILNYNVSNIDGRKEYRFDITGKRSLQEIADERKLCRDDVQAIYNGISNIAGCISDYLIEPEHILIEPEYIFISESKVKAGAGDKEGEVKGGAGAGCGYGVGYRVRFIFSLAVSEDFESKLDGLNRFVLENIDYDDKKLVELVCGIYDMTALEKQDISQLADYINDCFGSMSEEGTDGSVGFGSPCEEQKMSAQQDAGFNTGAYWWESFKAGGQRALGSAARNRPVFVETSGDVRELIKRVAAFIIVLLILAAGAFAAYLKER